MSLEKPEIPLQGMLENMPAIPEGAGNGIMTMLKEAAAGLDALTMQVLDAVGNFAAKGVMSLGAGVTNMVASATNAAMDRAATGMDSNHTLDSQRGNELARAPQLPQRERSISIDQDGNTLGNLQPTPIRVAMAENVSQGRGGHG